MHSVSDVEEKGDDHEVEFHEIEITIMRSKLLSWDRKLG